jgi:putative ABC transport system substrate-binding protein
VNEATQHPRPARKCASRHPTLSGTGERPRERLAPTRARRGSFDFAQDRRADSRTSAALGVVLALAFVGAARADTGASVAADGKPAPVVVLKSSDNTNYNRFVTGFAVESKLRYTEISLGGNEESGRKALADLKSQKPPLVLAVGLLAARLAKELVSDAPVVFAMVPAPEKHGLSGDNVTGVSLHIPMRQQLATLKTLAPNTKTVGVMYNPRHSKPLVEQAVAAAQAEGLKVVAAKIDSPDEVPDATRAFLGTIDALWMVPDQTVMNTDSFRHLLKFTFKNKVPFFSVAHRLVESGALVSLSPDYAAIGAQVGRLALKIVNEKVSPKDLPVADPEGLDIAVNLTTAKRIGVECDIALEIFTFAATRRFPIKVFK